MEVGVDAAVHAQQASSCGSNLTPSLPFFI